MGVAGEDDYTRSPKARAGIKKLRRYLTADPPSTLHQKAMMLWASTHLDGLADQATRNRWVAELLAAQKNLGGWVLIELGDAQWEREDDKAQCTDCDGYATAFVTYVLLEAGTARHNPKVAKAIQWLKQNQRESGRWYADSPRRDSKHFISHAATNFALLVLKEDEKQDRR